MKVVIASALAVCIAAMGGFALWSKRQQVAEPDIRPAVVGAHARTVSSAAPQTAGLVVNRRGTAADPWRIVLTRCIFSPRRVVPVDTSTASASATAALTLNGLSLRGISQEDSRYTAFVEDTANHHMIEARAGDRLAGGHVGDITLHDLEFVADGQSIRIEVGQTLSGAASAPIQAMARADKPAPPPVAAPPDAEPTPPKKKKRHAE